MRANFKNEDVNKVQSKSNPIVIKSPVSQLTPNENLGIEKIILHDNYTRIDFVYIASHEYINGGWIQMNPNCFIRPVGSDAYYKLLKAINIPIKPSKFYFQSQGQLHNYTLIFPALPKDTKQIDIIENFTEGDYFNFFNVKLQDSQPNLIRVLNEN